VPNLVGMADIIEGNNRFYVVAYDGADPHTGRERRRWHQAGRSRTDAEAIVERLTATRPGQRDRPTSALTVGAFVLDTRCHAGIENCDPPPRSATSG
jgi:hypothetical protein